MARDFADKGQPRGRCATRELSVGGFDLVENDIAVIEITSFNNDAARDRFLGLQGLPLYGGRSALISPTCRDPLDEPPASANRL